MTVYVKRASPLLPRLRRCLTVVRLQHAVEPFLQREAPLTLGRDICGDWNDSLSREWLVTNGLGGYACGTVAGANTRRYHGFLMASLSPPVDRTLLVSKVDVTVSYLGRAYPLFANEFAGGTVDPCGFVNLESFEVSDGIPVWRYAVADALLEQRIFMAPAANTSYLRLEVLRASAPLRVELKPLVTYRDYHSQSRGARPFTSAAGKLAGARGCSVYAFDGARPYTLAISAGSYAPTDVWYWNFLHREELARGMDALEDLWGPGVFSADLGVREPVFFTATMEADSATIEGAAAAAQTADPAPGHDVQAALAANAQRLTAALPRSAPPWIRKLAIASDQFIVHRKPARRDANTGETASPAAATAAATSIIAGYPWFTDWGRDTMIALPGLTTALRRYETAAAILRTFASFVDGGMLPNRFADAGETLEYNTADATLWMFQALRDYLDAKRDADLVSELFPTLTAIIHAHVDGTRYGIQVDPADGLLRAGEHGSQLTWMDAKQGDHAFTPRIGKPVEINALWLNALDVTARLAARLRNGAEKRYCLEHLARAGVSFKRFWNDATGCLYDVVDVSGTAVGGGADHDASIRPNQLFAVSLPYSVLTPDQMRAVVDVCARDLLTSYGLRSLSPRDAAYRPHYAGNAWERDAAYHQGTVWSWLLGPFARAHYRVYGDAASAQAFLSPIAQHLDAACLGSVSEVFDGDAPHSARGCFAQAWSVAEILRTWLYLEYR
jgi:predicted glycogen debranching enzyme